MDLNLAHFLVAGGAVAIAVAAVLWGMRVTDDSRGLIVRWREKAEGAEARLQRWDSVMGAFPGVALVWENDAASPDAGEWGDPKIYGSPVALSVLLRFADSGGADQSRGPAYEILTGLSGFKGRNRSGAETYLSPALQKLRREGEPFSLVLSSPKGMYVEIDGRTAGARAVLWIADSSAKGVEESGGMGRLDEARAIIARDPVVFLEMLDDAPFLAFRITAGRKLEWANKAYCAALETKTVDQAVARNVMLDVATADQARRVLEFGSPSEEVRFIVAQGQRRALRVLMFPSGGGVGGMAFDVTEAETTREALAKAERAHDETLDALAEGVAIFGPQRELVFHNRAFQQMWALEPAWLARRPSHAAWLDWLKEKRKLPAHASYQEWRANELAAYQDMAQLPETIWQLPEGRTIRIAKQRHPLGGLLLIFSDITDELKLKSQYNALLQAQRAALDKLHEAVVVFGLDGRHRLHNSAFEAMWKLSEADLQGDLGFERMTELWRPLYHDMEAWAEIKARITDPSPEVRKEYRGEMRRSDGAIITFLTRPLPDGATLIAFLDVTASRRVEEALRERAEAYAAADRLKTEFVENVSYQLRTPLQTIRGYAEVLAELMAGPLNDRQRDQVHMIIAASENLAKLIDDVLDVAMIEAGRLELELEDTPIAALLAEAAEVSAAKARESGVSLTVDVAPEVTTAKLDPKRIKQALMNLLSNALRFTEAGDAISLNAAVTEGGLRLSVSDTGRGMSLDRQAEAFDPFVSGDRRGAGLGLALVRSFIELHGGWVSLTSEPGVGATVTLHLPLNAAGARIAAE